MKLSVFILAILTVTLMTTSTADPLQTLDQRMSYVLGQGAARQAHILGVKIDPEAFKLAAEEVASDDEKLSMTDDEISKTIAEARQRASDNRKQEMEAASAENLKSGKEYLEANAKKEGVVTTKSGLQYKEIKAGSGPMPKGDDEVKVHYTGTLIDGKVFDSSVQRKMPASFPVSGVIKGWSEGLQLMNVGDKFQLTIPPELAYGTFGNGRDIGPNATLLFEVELLEIVK